MVTQLQAPRIDKIFFQYFVLRLRTFTTVRICANIIAGPEQVRSSDFAKELKKFSFKKLS